MYINIKDLRVYAYHGVHPEEKEQGQEFVLDISCLVSDESACTGDCVGQTVSYSSVAKKTIEIFTSRKRDLIEAAANDVAEAVIGTFPLVDAVDVTVKKPNAPVKADFGYMAVSVHRERKANGEPKKRPMKKAYLALGSNIGDGKKNITRAYDALNAVPGINVVKISEFYITAPWGYADQEDFTNACCEVETSLSPEALLGACLGIEAGMGRVREFKNGPRVIDVDIIMYDGETRNTEELRLPHPAFSERSFVLRPLLDVSDNGTALGFDVRAALERLGK